MTFKSVSACRRRRLRGDRGRVRSRHRDGEVLQHQVQGFRTHSSSCSPGKLIKARLDYASLIFVDRFLLKKKLWFSTFLTYLQFNKTPRSDFCTPLYIFFQVKHKKQNLQEFIFFNLQVATR
jgi:hypothetical protein